MSSFYQSYMRIGPSTVSVFRYRGHYAFATEHDLFQGYDSEASAEAGRTREIARLALIDSGLDEAAAQALIDAHPVPSNAPRAWVDYCRVIGRALPTSPVANAHAPQPTPQPRSSKAADAIERALREISPIYFLPAGGKRPSPVYGFRISKGLRPAPMEITDANRAELAKRRTERVVRLALEDHLGWPWQASMDAVKTIRELYPPKPGVRDRSDSLFWRVIEAYGEHPPAGYAASVPELEEPPTTPQLDPELEALLS